MYNLISSAKDSVDLSVGFDRDRWRRQRELTNNKDIKVKFHVRIKLKDIVGFAEHQEKATLGSGYKTTLTRNKDNVALQKVMATPDGRIEIDHVHWYVP